jgi:lipopolysaccharide assembly protein A
MNIDQVARLMILEKGNSRKLVDYNPISTREASMRLVYLIVIVLFVAAAIVFVAQNRDPLTISFLGFSVSAPVAILSGIMYFLGAVTGGSLFALLRHSVRKL